MNLHSQIQDPLIKQNKILQVDYFTSTIVSNPRENFQYWQQHNPVSTGQFKLWQYLQRQEIHQEKYFRFKKAVNQRYFGIELPEHYRQSANLSQQNPKQLSNTHKKIKSNIISNDVSMEMSVDDFLTSGDLFKSTVNKFQNKTISSFTNRSLHNNRIQSLEKSRRKNNNNNDKKKSRNTHRYWEEKINGSMIQEEDNQSQLYVEDQIHQKISTTNHKSIIPKPTKPSFNTLKPRPLSQQYTRPPTQKIKLLTKYSLNPESQSLRTHQHISTLSEKQKPREKSVNINNQRKSILDTITNKQQLMRFLRESRSIDPKKKGIFSLDDLTEFQKFNLTFPKYMQLKSLKKINEYAQQSKVKEKTGNLQKFQSHILQQFGMENENKRKLERVFEQIVWDCGRVQRHKKAERR